MLNESVLIAVTLEDGSVTLRHFFTKSRGNLLPAGATWADQERGIWKREPLDMFIKHELKRAHSIGSPMVSWRIVTAADLPAECLTKERGYYRSALKDTGAKLEYDIPKAREICRRFIRCYRPLALAELDGEWMKAFAKGDSARAAEVEAERQLWRDKPADPRIDAAQTLEELKQVWQA